MRWLILQETTKRGTRTTIGSAECSKYMKGEWILYFWSMVLRAYVHLYAIHKPTLTEYVHAHISHTSSGRIGYSVPFLHNSMRKTLRSHKSNSALAGYAAWDLFQPWHVMDTPRTVRISATDKQREWWSRMPSGIGEIWPVWLSNT